MNLSSEPWAAVNRFLSDRLRDPKRAPFVIFLTLIVTGFAGSAQTGLFDRDEPRYAQATREMIAQGEWLVPSFNGEPRLHKPVLIYWLMAPFFGLIGDSPLAARMPSIIAAAASGVLVFALANRWWGRKVALWATMVWATAPLTIVESRMATTDSVLNLWVIGMMACVTRLYGGPEVWTARLFWTLTGLSILTKGPIGLLFVASGVIATRFFTGIPLPRSWVRPKEGAAIVAAIVLPWFCAVTYRTNGEFLRFAVGRELLGRTVAPAEGHSGFPGYYLLSLIPLFLPWSCFLPMTLRKAWTSRTKDPRVAFLLGWAFGPLIFLELISTKLVHYHYPSYAALALLVGVEIEALERTKLRPNLMACGRSLGLSLNSVAALGVMAAVGFAWAFPISNSVPCLLIGIIMGGLLYYNMHAVREGQWKRVVRHTATAWSICALVITAWLLPVNESKRLTVRVAEAIQRRHSEIDSTLALGEFRDPSLINVLKTTEALPIVRREKDVREIVDRVGAVLIPLSPRELAQVGNMSDIRVRTLDHVEAVDWDRGKRRTIVITLLTRDPLERLSQLPSAAGRPTAKTSPSVTR